MTTESENNAPLLTFPCEFPIKVMGYANDHFETAVLSIIRKHVPHLKENALQNRLSKNGKYLAITISITADSKEQLDAIYLDLNQEESVLMTL
jgi:putative lipoic acid-binding regulatory protein